MMIELHRPSGQRLLKATGPEFRPNIRVPGSVHWVPKFSGCQRCDTSWAFVLPHSTYYNEQRGCFPMCEFCWGECTPEERLPYYRALFAEWGGEDEPEHRWSDIEAAVLAGK